MSGALGYLQGGNEYEAPISQLCAASQANTDEQVMVSVWLKF